ncbi:alpha/beta hydrolase [Actinospica durhamensis]|uniref:Alpha/beta hydrolase n=1 Tax=Actinospica durhamensis TaxID=1508375 RepID=A0A941IS44_9ACTN|nr:alpha/beta hydrolase [Actinospica durhamensis]MBR7832871.1 alpha/beta hydrolase [Actinospica durhamensis]
MSSVMKSYDLSFLILHGWQNRRPPGHWQYWLAGELANSGYPVEYPQLPEPDHPELEDWTAAIVKAAGRLETRERVVVCHSLGCLAWLHATTLLDAAGLPALSPPGTGGDAGYRVVLVAPPGRTFLRETSEIARFAPEMWPKTPNSSGPSAIETLLVRSDGDPYCPVSEDLALPRVPGLRTRVVPGQGHFDMNAGYGSWPGMLAWCTGRSEIVARRGEADGAAEADGALQAAAAQAL